MTQLDKNLPWPDALRLQVERQYLELLPAMDSASALPWVTPESLDPVVDWGFVQLSNVPLAAGSANDTHFYDFQSVLSAINTLASLQNGFRLVFMLTGDAGRYGLYLGVARKASGLGLPQQIVMEQTASIVRSHLTGLKTSVLDRAERDSVLEKLSSFTHASAITGIPTLRHGADRYLVQSIDRFASQLRQQKFAMLVVADPFSEGGLRQAYDRVLGMITEVHPYIQNRQGLSLPGNPKERLEALQSDSALVRLLASTSFISDEMKTSLAVIANNPKTVLSPALAMKALSMLPQLKGASTTITSAGGTVAVQREHLDRRALELERTLELHGERLRNGQNLGMWEVGVYLLSDSEATDQLGASLLRSVGSGDQTYLEPIRIQHLSGLRRSQKPRAAVQLLQFPMLEPKAFGLSDIHPLGDTHQRLTTILNTQELSIWMGMPGRDLPGISALPRPPKFAMDFAANTEGIGFGNLMDSGEVLHHELRLPTKDLTRHMFITGLTGSGKSTTSRALLDQLLERKIPLLIIEPAKFEYLEWGLELRRKGVPVRVYCPGRSEFAGEALDQLALNPFEVPQGYDVLSHIDRLKSVMTAAFPMQEVLPILLEAALMQVYESQGWLDDDRLDDLPPPSLRDLEQAVVRTLNDRDSGYAEEVRRNLQTALTHRIRSLRQGYKGKLLDQPRSTSMADLFDGITVVNISTLGADADKSLVMGLLMGLLYEYRTVQGPSAHGDLRHVTMVEEAHRILRIPRGDPNSPQAHTAEAFADLLAEVRAYGEGLIIVDQVPAKLIPDALKNTFIKVVHRLQARDDQEALAAAMGLTPEQMSAIPLLEQGQAIVQAGYRATLVKMPAPKESL